MVFCKNCGTALADGTTFCTNCGAPVEQAPQQGYAPPQSNYAAPQQGYVPPQPNYAAPQQGYVPPQSNYAAPQQGYGYAPQAAPKPSGLSIAAKVLMIISTVVYGFYLIPLAWCLPMTISYSNKIKYGQPVSTGFKVCTLLFVNLIAGILMLCDNDN